MTSDLSCCVCCFVFFKQKTAYEMRISDWSSDVCSSDLTIIPGMAVKDGKAVAPFGVMGGQYQSTGHANFISNILDLGLDVQEAMDASRSFATAGKLQVENTFPAETLAALEARGHVLEPMGRPLGGSQAVWIDHANGCLIAGSDPRKDGCALGY